MTLQPDTLAGAIVTTVVFVLGSARITRLVVADTLPPIVKIRAWYMEHAPDGWETLLHCPWCFSVWAVFLNGGAGWAAYAINGWVWGVWFWLNFLLATSYIAGAIVFHDED